ncbi:hypothetical protein ELUMI_v1c05060 [Williamsoniiplasma luminosum]|uniref:Uncharacterized protein n=2 Tax=Williamsoniiplasma luminosum TaxID=214888 RepID=A0A2K8NTR4_9MOLU|nr:hypothetical protein ELUMI_v1c05060 [Williamsoniiplasma luminosum]
MDSYYNLELFFLKNNGGECVFPIETCKHNNKNLCRTKIIILKLIDENERISYDENESKSLYYKLTSQFNSKEPKNSWIKLNNYDALNLLFKKDTYIRVGKEKSDFIRHQKDKKITYFPDDLRKPILSLKLQQEILNLFLNNEFSHQKKYIHFKDLELMNQKLEKLESQINNVIELIENDISISKNDSEWEMD